MEYTKKCKVKGQKDNGLRILIIPILMILLAPSIVHAACTGSSPTWVSTADSTSVNSCISSASAGDSINVQSGTFSWSPTLSKRVSLIGGYGGGTTTINGKISIVPTLGSDTYQLRVSNFTINGSGGTGMGSAVIQWGSSATNYNLGGAVPTNARLDHCNIFNGGTGDGMAIYGTVYGVIDNNTFGSSSSGFTYVLWYEYPYYTSVFGVSPQNIYIPGSGIATYFEDNVVWVNNDGRLIAHNIGGKAVFRYNTINLRGTSQGIMDIHGTQGTDYPSAFGVEYYGNLVLGSGLGETIDVRSGKNTTFWNAAPSNGGFQMYWGQLMSCPATNPDAQMIHDAYYWNNRTGYTGSTVGCYVGTTNSSVCGSYANRPLAGRDFFDDRSTSPGISSGTLASRPSTCTIGQGYWATDQTSGLTNLTNYVGDSTSHPSRQTIAGTLYKCTTTNTWTSFYTPYTYPHPLRAAADEMLVKPNPPRLLQP